MIRFTGWKAGSLAGGMSKMDVVGIDPDRFLAFLEAQTKEEEVKQRLACMPKDEWDAVTSSDVEMILFLRSVFIRSRGNANWEYL